MSASDYFDEVQRVYIAYYGRPADSGGLNYWADQLNAAAGNLNAIIDAFANSTEAQTLYGATALDARITQIYQQLLGRLPEAEGKSWWLNQLETGQKTLANLALDVLYGASGDDALVVANRLSAAQSFTDGLTSSGFNYSGDDAAQFARDFLSDVLDDSASLSSALSSLQSILSEIDNLSDDWDSSHGGGGSGTAELLPEDLAALASLVSLNNETGILSTANIREAVISDTSAEAYAHAFDPSSYVGAEDGVFTPEELGVSSLGTLSANSETVESLFYGTLIKALKAIDIQEIMQIQDFTTSHAEALQSGDEAVMSLFVDLMVSVFEDPANPALFTDAQVFDTAVLAGDMFVTLVGDGDTVALFDGLLTGFLPS